MSEWANAQTYTKSRSDSYITTGRLEEKKEIVWNPCLHVREVRSGGVDFNVRRKKKCQNNREGWKKACGTEQDEVLIQAAQASSHHHQLGHNTDESPPPPQYVSLNMAMTAKQIQCRDILAPSNWCHVWHKNRQGMTVQAKSFRVGLQWKVHFQAEKQAKNAQVLPLFSEIVVLKHDTSLKC